MITDLGINIKIEMRFLSESWSHFFTLLLVSSVILRNPCHSDTCCYRKPFSFSERFSQNLLSSQCSEKLQWPAQAWVHFHPLCQGFCGPFQSVNLFSSVLEKSGLFLRWLLSSLLFIYLDNLDWISNDLFIPIFYCFVCFLNFIF